MGIFEDIGSVRLRKMVSLIRLRILFWLWWWDYLEGLRK